MIIIIPVPTTFIVAYTTTTAATTTTDDDGQQPLRDFSIKVGDHPLFNPITNSFFTNNCCHHKTP
jgi:hypothetical protein